MTRVVATAALLLVVLTGSALVPVTVDASRAESGDASARQGRAFTVGRSMTINDPTRNPGTIARQMRRYVEHTPRGATISIMSFYLSSTITWPALRDAYRRGVNLRVVLWGGPNGTPQRGVCPEGVKLAEMINAGRRNGRRGSWVVWTRNVARGPHNPDATMHAKVWQFSRVGRTRKVTMVGSYNNGDPPDGRAYSAMVTLTYPKLYDDVQAMFLESAKDRNTGGNQQRRRSGNGWDAYFFPSNPITRENDPALERLRAIPGAPSTRIKISMYSWQGYRGAWLAHRLARMVRAGARVTVVVGPDVAPSVVRTLREAGARLEDGCWRTGRPRFPYAYTHMKEMTATWVEGGRTHYSAWIGSDDWGNGGGGSQGDQVTLGLHNRWAYNRLNKLLAPQIAHEPDNLTGCDPLPGRSLAG